MRIYFFGLAMVLTGLWALLGGGSRARALDATAALDDKWEEIDQSDGVTVYRRKVPQDGLFEFRGVGVVDVSIPKLIALMADAGNLPSWMFGCIKGELLERNFDEDQYDKEATEYFEILYGINSLPWPVKNRDYVLKAGIKFMSPTPENPFRVNVVTSTVNHAQKPVVEDLVRMPQLSTSFVLSPIAGKSPQTKVDIVIAANPGGYIPHWVTNIASRMLPRKTLGSLRELVKTEEYNKKLEALVLYHLERNTGAPLNLSH